MEYIIVYDKKTSGNPIVAIHSQRFSKGTIKLEDIHPDDDPNEHGVVVVPGEIINQMVIRKYKLDIKGNVIQKTVEQEKTKELTSIMDTSTGQNVLVFGEPITEIRNITNLMKQTIDGTVMNAEKGIIGIGGNTGFFTVTANVDTGLKQPEIISEKQNWKWKRNDKGEIIGMDLIKKIDI